MLGAQDLQDHHGLKGEYKWKVGEVRRVPGDVRHPVLNGFLSPGTSVRARAAVGAKSGKIDAQDLQ